MRDLAEIIRLKGMNAYNGAMVSVTVVKVSPDLSMARVHLSIFPSSKAQEVIKIVNSSARELRYELGQKVSKQLRIVPELTFFIDDSLDYVERIDELLKK